MYFVFLIYIFTGFRIQYFTNQFDHKGSDDINSVKYSTGRPGVGTEHTGENAVLRLSHNGNSEKETLRLRERFGSNLLTKRKRKSFFSHFISNLNDPIIKILLGALCLNVFFSFRHSNLPETIGVGVAIIIATTVSTVSEYSSSKAAERLSAGEETLCLARRGGSAAQIKTGDIVVGDVVLLNPGMTVPADGILISGDIICNQSALTGEGKEIKKQKAAISDAYKYISTDVKMDSDDPSLVFRGTTVVAGNGECIVLRVGDSTLYGQLAAGLQDGSPESPLKQRLTVLAREISFIGYIAALMVAVSYLFNVFFIDSGMNTTLAIARMKNIPYLLHELLNSLTLAVSVLVVAVPEGLPMMITVVLSSNMKRMLRHGVLVKRMVGIETAGAMSILFTDKTGTLTEGKMTLYSVISADSAYTGVSKLRVKKELYGALYGASLSIPLEGGHNSADSAAKEFFGITGEGNGVIARIPFSSERRFAAAATSSGTGEITYVRGAPELIFEGAALYLTDDGSVLPMSRIKLTEIREKWITAARRGARVIASGFIPGNRLSELSEGKFPGLVFCGLLCFEDRLRRDAAKSVEEARGAGIKTVMMTGDNKITAIAIAEECGIYREGDQILTGDELSMLSDDELTEVLPRLSVIARALPSDKQRVIKAAHAAGYISGMTGDGINDAPSLRAADIGFAMGSGTDVAKEAGDIVITNNSFSSIIRAALYGRTIFRSIRKFIAFQLTMNLCATAVSFIGPFVGIEAPVTIIQMLWVNIIMDTLGSLAFAGEPPRKEYMKRAPLPSNVKILTGEMVFGIVFTGMYMVGLSMYFLLSPRIKALFAAKTDTYFLTAFFAFFIFCGIALSFNFRTPKLFILSGISKNRPFAFIMTAVAVIQLLLVYFGGETFRCTPVSPKDLCISALIASSVIPVGMVIKLFQKRRFEDL